MFLTFNVTHRLSSTFSPAQEHSFCGPSGLHVSLSIYMRGTLGPIRNRKTGQNFHQNRKTGRKIAQNRKNAENNDQNCKFVIFSPSTLDTTGKILALETIQCPYYTVCSANLMRIIPKKFLQCSTKGIASSVVSVSFEGETFVTHDELKKVRTMRQFARKSRITAFLFIKTETRMSKREKP